MFRKLTIGLRYKHQDAWVGGVYYVRNLVSALGLLPKARRPKLVIVGGDKAALKDLKQATGYADLHRISRTRLARAPAVGLRLPFGRPGQEEIDLLLMGSPPGLEDRGVQWIPDLQEHRFPEFFDAAELQARYARNDQWLASHRHVMVSSQDVAADVARHYGRHANRVHVVRFASFVTPPQDVAEVRAAHALPDRYFICTNQMWRHKNHEVVLRALADLDAAAPPVVFTGREEDYRDPAFAPSLKALAKELGVEGRAWFLGFLPREEQLALMAGALAVVQPSLCEGWSTVVEDAKALDRHVLASDIAVHREQLDRNADFFEPHDFKTLAVLMRRHASTPPAYAPADYQVARRRFAQDLLRMANEVRRDFRRRRIPRLVINR